MIRWAVEADRWPIIRLMQRAGMGAAGYTYEHMDGMILVDVEDGASAAMRGYVSFWLGRPETYIRQLVVAPEHRDGRVLMALMAALLKVALAYGAQGLEGFQTDAHPEIQDFFAKLGATPQAGTRSRWPLTPGASPIADRWRETLLAD